MKIQEVTIHKISMALHTPYAVAYKTYTTFDPVIVEVRGADGRIGWGESNISPGASKETPESGYQFSLDAAEKIAGMDSEDAKKMLLEQLLESKMAISAIVPAIEMMEDHPILHFNEETRLPLLTPFNSRLGDDIENEVEQHLKDGYKTLKIKVGKPSDTVEIDLEYMAAIQKVNKGRAELRLDANRGYTREQGCKFASNLDPDSIMHFEQPCAADAWDDNAAVAKVSTVPLMLDESISTLNEVERAGTIDGVGMCKVKLKRSGSLTLLKQGIERCKELGMQAILGDGTGMEIGNWMEAAVAKDCIDNAGEYNGFLKLNDEIFKEGLRFEHGEMIIPAGYYPEVDEEKLESLALEKPVRFTVPQTALKGAAE
ncbi:MAG: mandelate racemase/muconate lactonizing enzyme family protein [Rhodospirillales bacterium]